MREDHDEFAIDELIVHDISERWAAVCIAIDEAEPLGAQYTAFVLDSEAQPRIGLTVDEVQLRLITGSGDDEGVVPLDVARRAHNDHDVVVEIVRVEIGGDFHRCSVSEERIVAIAGVVCADFDSESPKRVVGGEAGGLCCGCCLGGFGRCGRRRGLWRSGCRCGGSGCGRCCGFDRCGIDEGKRFWCGARELGGQAGRLVTRCQRLGSDFVCSEIAAC